jgi:hypothetical protein
MRPQNTICTIRAFVQLDISWTLLRFMSCSLEAEPPATDRRSTHSHNERMEHSATAFAMPLCAA